MSNTKELFYAISVQLDVPFELYVDDIPLAKEYSEARTIMGIDLNPYVLKPGVHQLSIKLLPTVEDGKAMVRPRDVKYSKVKLVRYEKQYEPGMGRAKNYEVLRKLPLPELDQPVPTATAQWKITLPDLPYRLEGWSRGRDLRGMDREELKKKVVAFYEKMRKLLNEGNPETFFKYTHQDFKEMTKYAYYSKKELQQTQAKDIELYKEEAKGNMWPIENYKMFIYGHGRLVKLERTDKKNRGWNAMIREIEDGTITTTGMLLYMPKGSDTFEIIRK